MGASGASDELRQDWARLGSADPLWAVLMKPGTKDGGWDRQAFLATGREEVDRVLAVIRDTGLHPGHATALDVGCGAGRTAIALAAHVDRVTGVDISEGMLDAARALAVDTPNLNFHLNTRDDLSAFEDNSVDIVYSSLVVQHLPPALALSMLGDMARVVRPGGVVAVQVASVPLRNLKGLAFRYAPWPLIRLGQTRLLGYPAPMRMSAVSGEQVAAAFARHRTRVVAVREDSTYGGHWRYHRYFGTKVTG